VQDHATPAAVLHGLRSDLLQKGVQLHDDLTMVVVQRRAAGPAWARTELPLDWQALRQVRDFVNTHTAAAGLDDAARALLEVACVEAYTNILRHGRGLLDGAPVELVARREPALLVFELVHLGEAFAPPADTPDTNFGLYPEGGFGLQIIRGASDGVVYLHQAGVNTIRLTKKLR
jgi:anti-sigma regulatory factor (Ser/Thr protein kinase)